MRADRLVGLGLGGLVADEAGLDVPVDGRRRQRGKVEVAVTLPDGQRATLLLESMVRGESLRVSIDPDAVVTVRPSGH